MKLDDYEIALVVNLLANEIKEHERFVLENENDDCEGMRSAVSDMLRMSTDYATIAAKLCKISNNGKDIMQHEIDAIDSHLICFSSSKIQ